MALFFNMVDVAVIAALIIWTDAVEIHMPYNEAFGRLCILGTASTTGQPIQKKSVTGRNRCCHICQRWCDRKYGKKCSGCHLSCRPDRHKITAEGCLKLIEDEKKKTKHNLFCSLLLRVYFSY